MPKLKDLKRDLTALVLGLGSAVIAAGSSLAAEPPIRAHFDWFDYNGSSPAYEGLPRPGTYLNPILTGMYPDPNILRVGDDFYLVNSSMGYFPGLPIFHSRDLVSWNQIGNALSRPEQFSMRSGGVSYGAYAPALAFYDGLFYLINKCVTCGGNYWISATNPAGPWSNPNWMPSVVGFDPSLFFDADGKAYVVYSERAAKPAYNGHTGIWVQQWDMAGNQPVGERVLILDKGVGTNPYYAEGPHVFKRGDFYYLTAAQGGTGAEHSQIILRAKSVKGPYEAFAGNPILTQVGAEGAAQASPITSTGHASFVQTGKGEWWAVFLGTQPYEGDYYNTGRDTFLLPVRWTKDGWPTILPHGQAVPRTVARPRLPRQRPPAIPTSGNFSLRDEFDRLMLAPYWMMLRTPEKKWWSLDRGNLTIEAGAVALGAVAGQPSYLARRQQHVNATFTTRVRFAPTGEEDRGGLALFHNEGAFFFFGIGQRAGQRVIKLESRIGRGTPLTGTLVASAPLTTNGPVDLRITAQGSRYSFAFAVNGRWQTLVAEADGKGLSTKAAGGFVGTTAGPYAYSSPR
jgi:xylan 1,4-beta-xylosidase